MCLLPSLWSWCLPLPTGFAASHTGPRERNFALTPRILLSLKTVMHLPSLHQHAAGSPPPAYSHAGKYFGWITGELVRKAGLSPILFLSRDTMHVTLCVPPLLNYLHNNLLSWAQEKMNLSCSFLLFKCNICRNMFFILKPTSSKMTIHQTFQTVKLIKSLCRGRIQKEKGQMAALAGGSSRWWQQQPDLGQGRHRPIMTSGQQVHQSSPSLAVNLHVATLMDAMVARVSGRG